MLQDQTTFSVPVEFLALSFILTDEFTPASA